MRISDWSSDVCSSDLGTGIGPSSHARRLQVIEAQTGDNPAQEGGRNPHRRLVRLCPTDERLLHHILRIGHRAEHSIGNTQQVRPVSIEGDGSAFHHFQRSEEHTSELQSLMRISYAVFCLKKKKMTMT